MKNTDRKISAALFSAAFVWMAFCLRFVLLSMSLSQAPMIVTAELLALVLMGAVAVYAWKSTESYTAREKRCLGTLLGLYAALNLICISLEQQMVLTALSTLNQALGKNEVLAWIGLAVKLLLPALGVWFACRRHGRSTVVFEEAAEPESLETEEALEELTVQLDESEIEE